MIRHYQGRESRGRFDHFPDFFRKETELRNALYIAVKEDDSRGRGAGQQLTFCGSQRGAGKARY
jgi:hypothetical protein